MISKELIELIDALARNCGENIPPYKELEMLGLDPFGKEMYNTVAQGNRLEWITINSLTQHSEPVKENDEEQERYEYYEFDENDRKYAILLQLLRISNDWRRYFA